MAESPARWQPNRDLMTLTFRLNDGSASVLQRRPKNLVGFA
jgi:hypothetical protein